MPQTIETISYDRLLPKQHPGLARKASGKFGASLTLAKGTALAIKTSDGLLYPYVEPNDVQTLTFAGTPTVTGLLYLTLIDKDGKQVRTEPVTFSATLATLVGRLQTATDNALAANAIVWAGVSGTTNPVITATFSGANYAAIKQTLIRVETEAMTQGNVKVEHSTAYDGKDVCVGYLEVALKTDANSKVFLGSETSTANIRATPLNEAPYYTAGYFDTADLTGHDAAALVDLGGKSKGGTLVFVP